VPKPGLTSRPAALLTLTDRVVYEALVSLLRPSVSKYLIDDDVVLWPREMPTVKRWHEFEKSPLATEHRYVVQADVSGFYESIDHDQIEDDLVKASGDAVLSNVLRSFLSRVMGTRRGIPQGLLASDSLATIYLQPVDATMVRDGFNYWRHGDDMIVAAESMSKARGAISSLEDELRQRGLLVNASKVAILTREQYEADLEGAETTMRAMQDEMFQQNVERVSSDSQQLQEAMNDAGLNEQWGWDLFYHGEVSLEEVIEQLRPHLTPSDIEVAEQIFLRAFERAPGRINALSKEHFHLLISRSLIRLAASRSVVAIPHAASLLARFPEKTEIVSQYLQAVIKLQPQDVINEVENIIHSDLFTTPWQQAWLYRVLALASGRLQPKSIAALRDVSNTDGTHWLARVEAMKVLGRARKLDQQVLTRSWRLAPRPYRCDLLEAAAYLESTEECARRFLAAARLDPVEKVVAAHVLVLVREGSTRVS
jgi:Reverse transcriptase (RNA-dependent DNA polymerase)